MAIRARRSRKVFSVKNTLDNTKQKLPSKAELLAAVLLILVLSPVFSFLKPTWAFNTSSALSMSVMEDIALLNNGYADLHLVYNVSGSRLADVYRNMLAASTEVTVGEIMSIPESRCENNITIPVRDDFCKSVKDYQRLAFGFRTWILDSSMTPRGQNGECVVYVNGIVAPQVATSSIIGSDALVKIAIGPKDDNATVEAIQNLFNQVVFAQSLIKSLNETCSYECLWTTRIEIPGGSRLLDDARLNGTMWFVDFGGGTSLAASIFVDGSTIVVEEKMVVSEAVFSMTPADICGALQNYRVFAFEYLIPNMSYVAQVPSGVDDLGDWSKKWDWEWDYLFNWTYHDEGHDPNGGGTLDLVLTIHPKFTFSAYIGWEFGGFLGIVPQWFELWVAPQASVSLSLDVKCTEIWKYTMSDTIKFDIPLAQFAIGPVPVWINLNIYIKPQVTFESKGLITVKFSAEVHAGFKAGCRWENRGGPLGTWDWIWEKNFGASKTGPIVHVEANFSIDPQLGIEVALLLWDLVGPALEVDVFGHAQFDLGMDYSSGSPVTGTISWSAYIGLKIVIKAIIGDNYITSLLGIANKGPSYVLYNDKLWEWKGSMGGTPTEISCEVDPDQVFYGSGVTIQGNVSSEVAGDLSGEVSIFCTRDTTINQATRWEPIGNVAVGAKGNYSLHYTPSALETYKLTFMGYYGGNKKYGSSECENYPSVNVVVLSPPGYGLRLGEYILEPTMAKRIITYPGWEDNPHNPDIRGPYPYNGTDGLDPWNGYNPENQDFGQYFSYNYRSSYPDQNTSVFYFDDEYAYSWFRMCWFETSYEALIPCEGPYVHLDLYDPSGKFLYEVANITNTYEYSNLPSNGWNLDPNNPYNLVGVDCLPPAYKRYPDDTIWEGYPGPMGHGMCWPEWRPWTAFKIDPSWTDKGPLTIVVHIGGIYGDILTFNQTFTVTRHPVTAHLWFGPYSDPIPDQYLADNLNVSLYEPQILQANFTDDQNLWLNQAILQYSTEENASKRTWENCTTIEHFSEASSETNVSFSFTASSTGDYYLRVLYEGDPRNQPSTSTVKHLRVDKIADLMTVELSSQQIFSGDSVNVTATLSTIGHWELTPDGDPIFFPAGPLRGKNVTIQYGKWNETLQRYAWYFLSANGTTDDAGQYACPFTAQVGEPVTYQFRAILYDDSEYANCESYLSPTTELSVMMGFPTSVEILNGSDISVERAFSDPVNFQARVTGILISDPVHPEWNYLQSVGTVEFYVNNVYVGADNDSDGNRIYEINWDFTSWPFIENQTWTAYFVGVPSFLESMANSTVEVYRSHVDISVGFSSTITLEPGESTSIAVTLTMSRGAPDTFTLSVEGLARSWYRLSNDSIYLHTIPNLIHPESPFPDVKTVTLDLTLPIIPDSRHPLWHAQTCLMTNNFAIVAKSTLDSLSEDSEPCVLNVDFQPLSVPATPTGGMSVFIEPKTTKIVLPDEFELAAHSTIPGTLFFVSNVTVYNDEDFYDVVGASINVDGIAADKKADLRWFNWTSVQIFMPPHSYYTIGVRGQIKTADFVSSIQSVNELTRTYHVTVNSTVWSKSCASDTATLTVTDTLYNQDAGVTITAIDRQINTYAKEALFFVSVTSTAAEDQNVKLTLSGDEGLEFNWTTQELVLSAGNSQRYDLSIAYSGTGTGDFAFTVLNEAWPLNLTSTERTQLGIIETNSFTEYVEVTSQALSPAASFTYSPVAPLVGDTVTFDASASNAINKTILSYSWDFGDSNSTTTANPIITHVYSAEGAYNVNLTVTDSESLTGSANQTLTVYILHDVAITNVTIDRLWVYQGFTANVNVTVLNKGDSSESVVVTLFYNITASGIISTQNVTLSPAQSRTITFTWDTTGVPFCQNYTITAVATIASDNNLADNTLTGGTIEVRIRGDINGDGSVTILDAIRFGTYFGLRNGDAGWSADADINRDGKVNILDVIMVAQNFGKNVSP